MKVWVDNSRAVKVRRIPHWPHRYKRWEYWGGHYATRCCESCGHEKKRRVYFI